MKKRPAPARAKAKTGKTQARVSRPAPSAKTGRRSTSREVLHTGRQLERIQQIHAVLAEGKPVNVPTLLRRLGEDDRAAKTIRRDLAFMRDRMNLPVSEYDAAKGGFYYTEAVTNLPLIQVTEGELLALLVARQAVEAYRGTPYARLLERAFAKLRAGLGDAISIPAGGLSDAISFRATGAGVVDEALFTAVSKAVLDRREVTLTYQKPGEDEPEPRRVRPHHLASIGGMWYLAAHDLDRDAMRTFALPRISGFSTTKTRFLRDPGFSPETYFGDSLGVLRGEGTLAVRIAFDAYAAALVRERFWHDSQVFTEKPSGGLELELRLSHADEVMRWVLSWGEHARVLSPDSLIERIRRTAEQVSAAYASQTQTRAPGGHALPAKA